MDDPTLAAIAADLTAVCQQRLRKVTGTHALLLDGLTMPLPAVAGVACWTTLRSLPGVDRWHGSLQVGTDALPFADESFCAVLVRCAQHARIEPAGVATELVRVLAPRGVLLVSDLHPRSLWHAGSSPGDWERVLRGAGLELVQTTSRCGSPWPRVGGEAGLPHWLVRGLGGAWVLEARRRTQAAIPLRKAAQSRRTVEHKALVPGARRQCA